MPQIAFTQADMSRLDLAAIELAKRKIREGEGRVREGVIEFLTLQWGDMLCVSDEERKDFPSGLRLDDFQLDIILAAFDPSVAEIFIKGCTKPGKGFAVALLANMFYDVYFERRTRNDEGRLVGKNVDPKVIITSSSVDHAKRVMFGEIRKLRSQMKHPVDSKPQTEKIVNPKRNSHYMTVVNPNKGEGFSGQHGPRVLFIFDEATATDDEFFDDAKKQSSLLVALSNPRILSGWFRDAYKPATKAGKDENETQFVNMPGGRRYLVTVSAGDTKNVKRRALERPFAPEDNFKVRDKVFNLGDRIPKEYYEDVKPLIDGQLDYTRYLEISAHRDPRHVSVFRDGRFPDEDDELQLFLYSWFDRHHECHEDLVANGEIPIEAMGIDVSGADDGDSTIITLGGRKGIREQRKFPGKPSTGMIVKWVEKITYDNRIGDEFRRGKIPIAVDADGLGKGVADSLIEKGYCVIALHGNATSDTDSQIYANMRTEVYGELAWRLNPKGPWSDEPFAVPRDGMLVADLCAQERDMRKDQIKFSLIPKRKPPGKRGGPPVANIKEKIGRSPDKGDSAAYFFKALRTLGLQEPRPRKLVHTIEKKPKEAGERTKELYEEIDREAVECLVERLDGNDGNSLVEGWQPSEFMGRLF